MSVEIVYDKKFIKVGEDQYIPMYMHGSSNCTMFVGRKEIYERYWDTLFGKRKKVIFTQNELLEIAKSYINPDSYCEWFRMGSRGGKMIEKEQIFSFINSGCKNAHTLEEFVKAGYPLYCKVRRYTTEEGWSNHDGDFVRTTEELLNWIDRVELRDENEYLYLDFCTIKAIKIGKKLSENIEPSVVKTRNGYLTKYENGTRISFSTSMNIADAMIFESAEELEKVKDMFKHFHDCPMRIVKASTAMEKKPYYLYVEKGNYAGYNIKKIHGASLYYTRNNTATKYFKTEKEAEKFRDKVLTAFSDFVKELTICKVED